MGEGYGLVNGGVCSRLNDQNLVYAESKKIPCAWIQRCEAQLPDPKIKQTEIAQDAIEQLEGESAIRRAKRAARKNFGNEKN